jgi:ABC-2 type transport system ATP-binding protein
MEIRLSGISKVYGKKQALYPLTLSLEPGIYALLGPNGAGKSTLMNIMAGVLEPTTGNIFLNRRKESRKTYQKQVGYLPQKFGGYDAFSGRDMLYYFAALKGLPFCKELKEQIEEAVELFDLKDDICRPLHGYSGGMRQRIGIIQAFLGEPGLLILDEPTAGLDPRQRICFKRQLERRKKDQIILLSTHILSDVDEIADKILIMKEGELKAQIPNDSQVEAVYMKYFGGEDEYESTGADLV